MEPLPDPWVPLGKSGPSWTGVPYKMEIKHNPGVGLLMHKSLEQLLEAMSPGHGDSLTVKVVGITQAM